MRKAILIAGFIGLASCNSVKKTLSKEYSKADSTVEKKEEIRTYVKSDSAIFEGKKVIWSKETVIQYDTLPGKPYPVIKYITIREKGGQVSSSSKAFSNIDTSKKGEELKISLKTEDKAINKTKKSSRFPVLPFAIIFLILLLIVGGWVYYKKQKSII